MLKRQSAEWLVYVEGGGKGDCTDVEWARRTLVPCWSCAAGLPVVIDLVIGRVFCILDRNPIDRVE